MPVQSVRSFLDEILRTALMLGVVLTVLVPAVREMQTAFGWLPLWLVGMPATALWASRLMLGQSGPAHGHEVRASAMRRPLTGHFVRRRVRRVPRDALPRAA